jgi:hypothetical protein
MTLIVGRRNLNGVVHVVGDMRLTDPAEIRRGYRFAVLKNIILSPDHLVAFAGNADLGMHMIRRFKDAPIDELANGLLDSAREAGAGPGSVDYLLAHTERGLQRITASGVEEPTEAGWIGDPAAFEVYQQGYHARPVPKPIWIEGVSPPRDQLGDPAAMEPFIRMATGTYVLMEDQSVASVGEVFVTANSKRGFHYEQQGFFQANHEQEIGSGWTTLNWGTAAQGGFGFNLLPPKEHGIGAIGLYFRHGGLGLLYHPLAYDDALAYRRVTHDEFCAAVAEDHRIEIDGGRLV